MNINVPNIKRRKQPHNIIFIPPHTFPHMQTEVNYGHGTIYGVLTHENEFYEVV